MASGGTVKGTAIRTLLEATAMVHGEHGRARVLAALPTELRLQLAPVVLASKPYAVEISAALQEAIHTELGYGEPEPYAANRKIGAAAARIDFGGVYSAFLRVADYETLLRGLERAWRQYNSQGTVVWHAIDKTSARGEVHGTVGYTEAMWTSIAGRIEAILVLGGAKSARVTLTRPTAQGVELEVRWTR